MPASPAAAARPPRAARRGPRLPRLPPAGRRTPPPRSPARRPARQEGGTASLLPLPPSPFPSLFPVRISLDAVIDAHETAEATHTRAHEGEPGTRAEPAVHQPSQRAEEQDGEGEREAERDVRVAFAEALGEPVFVVVRHDADGNIRACEKFRKQSPERANLCGAWEYDVVTLH